jgi:hypothetical protein
MPIPPIDPNEHPPNPFILEPSKLVRAAANVSKLEQSAGAKRTTATQPVAGGAKLSKTDPHFAISTQQIISLITRFRMRSFTFDQLENLPFSQLNPVEKDFVNYLRRNPGIFHQIAKLDHDPDSISVEDIKIAARLAGDALVLSDEDLQYLKKAPLQQPVPVTEENQPQRSGKLQTQDLIDTVQKLNPNGLSFEELMNLDAVQAGLRGRDLQSLRFLQSPTVSKVLEKVVTPYDGVLTPEALRVLTSLLWNPAIYGAAPVVFFRMAPMSHEHEVDPIVDLHSVDAVDNYKKKIRSPRQKPMLKLEAHHIMNICHKLSPDGRVSLKQLRKYQPHSIEEEKALNLLRQTHIFQALANLDHDPDYLSDDDIQLALAEGSIVLSDPYMVLVILP